MPSLLVWSRLPRREVGPARRTRRLDLSLLLQVAALAAILTALARPVRAAPPAFRGSLAVILDRTTSMAAGGRWEEAGERLAALLRGLGPQDQLTLILLDDRPRVAARLSHLDGARLQDLLGDLRPAGTPADLEAAWRLAQATRSEGTVLITDGGLTGAPPPELEVLRVGRPLANQALVDVDAAALPSGGHQLYLRVANFSDRAAAREIRVTGAGLLLHLQRLEIEAEGVFEASWRLPPGLAEIEVELRGRDGLALDDRARLDLAARPGPRLELDPDVPQPAGRVLGALAGAGDLQPPVRIAWGSLPQEPAPGGILVLAGGPQTLPLRAPLAAASPLVEGLLLAELEGLETSADQPPGDLEPLLWEPGGPVVLAHGQRGPARVAWLGLQLDGEALQRASVLVLLERLLQALGPPSLPRTAVVGAPVEIPARPWLETLTAQGPSGTLTLTPGEAVRFQEPGLYRIEGLGSLSVLATHGRETDLRPTLAVPQPRAATLPATAGRRDVAPWLVLLAAALLALEAWWTRRWRALRPGAYGQVP